MKAILITIISVILMGLPGCMQHPTYSPDEMYTTEADNETIYVFRFGDEYIETGNYYKVSLPEDISIEDGTFCKIVADVTYSDGGIAAFHHYPTLNKIHSCTEISPDDLDLPYLSREKFGLTRTSGYAGIDYFLWARGSAGVYKDGKWLYTYECSKNSTDGSVLCYNEGVTEEQINKGIAEGILCCEDYFITPEADE